MNKNIWRVDLGVFVVLVIFFFIAYAMGQTLTPFIAAALFAYLLNPAVNSLQRRNLPRWLASTVFILLFVLIVCAVVAAVVYVLQKEISLLIDNLPAYTETFERQYLPRIARYVGLAEDIKVSELGAELRHRLSEVSPESMKSAAGYVARLLSGTLGFFLGVFNLILIPVLMAYILLDMERIKKGLADVMPVHYRQDIISKLKEVERVLRDFVKGQFLVSVIMGVLYAIGLLMVGIDMPIVVGMSSGLLNLVPYLGGAIGIAVSVVLAVLKFQDLLHPVLVLAVFGAVQTLEGYLITPKIVGERLGLHPVVIILSLMVLGNLLGFVGVLLAVPIAAVLKVFIVSFVRDYKASALYSGK